MITIKKVLLNTLILVGASSSLVLAKEQFDPGIIEKSKKAVVTIHGQASLKAYELFPNSWSGTGFIINKAKGHILTNAHIVGRGVVGAYYLFFHDGSRVDAKVLYYDPWLDYAFLQIDPASIPADATEIKFSAKDPIMDQPVFIIGNNEGKSFSIHIGTVTNLYEITGSMPQHSIRVSLNTRGGSSGSPIINQRGEAIALNYGGSDTFGIALHPAYLRYAIDFIEKGKTPTRQHIGVLTETYSLNEAVKYRKFPIDQLQKYNKLFPGAVGNAIQVTRTLHGSPADGKLLAGDIIWEVNKTPIGTNLSQLDLTMNNPKQDSICLGICRNGELQELILPLYNLEDHKIKQMISFGGTLFSPVDDVFSARTGIPAKTLTFSIIQGSNTFDKVFPYIALEQGRQCILHTVSFDKTPITNLKQLTQAIPAFIQQKYFTLHCVNYMPYQSYFGNWYNLGIDYRVADVSYDANSSDPKIFTFDDEKMEWEAAPILIK